MNLSRILHAFCLARLQRLELLTLLWSSGVICVIATVSLTPSLSMIILCNRKTVLIIMSTCFGLICNSVFRHLHFATSFRNAQSTVRRALLSRQLNISFVETLCHYPWDMASLYILLVDIADHLLTHTESYIGAWDLSRWW